MTLVFRRPNVICWKKHLIWNQLIQNLKRRKKRKFWPSLNLNDSFQVSFAMASIALSKSSWRHGLWYQMHFSYDVTRFNSFWLGICVHKPTWDSCNCFDILFHFGPVKDASLVHFSLNNTTWFIFTLSPWNYVSYIDRCFTFGPVKNSFELHDIL